MDDRQERAARAIERALLRTAEAEHQVGIYYNALVPFAKAASMVPKRTPGKYDVSVAVPAEALRTAEDLVNGGED